MKEKFRDFNPRGERREVALRAVAIAEEYGAAGYVMTLRQLYYQLVSRDVIPNTERSYKNLSALLTEAREGGWLAWDALEDRGRELSTVSTWSSPSGILRSAALGYRSDRMGEQPVYLECWIEKDALAGVVEPVALGYQVPFLAARGYGSATALYDAGVRFQRALARGKRAVLLYMGDHDPSGLDMGRDIEERIGRYGGHPGMVEITRLALNMDQVEAYGPPPNPAKVTDPRAGGYLSEYGGESWELDALPPDVLAGLAREAIEGLLDMELYEEGEERDIDARKRLLDFAEEWEEEGQDE